MINIYAQNKNITYTTNAKLSNHSQDKVSTKISATPQFKGEAEQAMIGSILRKLETQNAPFEISAQFKFLLNSFEKYLNKLQKLNPEQTQKFIDVEPKLTEKNIIMESMSKIPQSMDINQFLCLCERQDKKFLSPKQTNDLTKTYKLYDFRSRLNVALLNTVITLNSKYKNPEIEKMLNKLQNSFEHQIRQVGISEEIRTIVTHALKNFNTKLELPQNPELSKNVFEELKHYKNLGYNLPDNISFCDFYYFRKFGALGRAYFTHNLDQTYITENPYIVATRPNSNTLKTLRHELGHFWHYENRTQEFKTGSHRSFLNTLSTLEKENLTNLYLKKDPSCLENGSIYNKNLNALIHEATKFRSKTKTPEQKELLEKAITKLEHLKELINKEYKNSTPKHRAYAKFNATELVATATEVSEQCSFSNEFRAILKKIGAADLKDRSNLPENHPVIQKINEIENTKWFKLKMKILNLRQKLFESIEC